MPCYVVIGGMKQAMDEDIFDKNGWSTPPIQQPPQLANPSNTHSLETRQKLWQETIGPRLFFEMLKETIKTLPMPRLRTDHQQ